MALASSLVAGYFPARKASRVYPGRHHPGGDMSGRRTSPGEVEHRVPGEPLIVASGVTRILPGVVPTTLVHDIDLTIGGNEFVAITGPSGSGKSSLLYLLGLLDLPTAGEVRIRGRATAHMDEAERASVRLSMLGFVFQFHFLLPEFTALENVMLPMRALGQLPAEADARAGALRCSPRSGSPSMPRSGRTSSPAASASAWRWPARSPTIRPSSWPTSRPARSTPSRASRCSRSCASWSTRGKTVVAVTHDLDLARRMDRRIVLEDGSIVSDETGSR